MDLAGRWHDDHLCLNTILVDLTLDILHDLTEQVFELQELDLAGALAEADIAGAHILVHPVDEWAHQDEDVGVLLAHAGHELLKSVVQEVAFRGEWARGNHTLDRLLLLELIEALELGKVAKGLGWSHCELVQAIHIEFRVGVVEAFCDDHFALKDGVLGHFVQVEFDAILRGAIFISEIEKTDAVRAKIAIFRAQVNDSTNYPDTILDRLPKLLKLLTPQVLLEQRLEHLKLPLQILSPHARSQIVLIVLRDNAAFQGLDLYLAVLVVDAGDLVHGHVERVTAHAPRLPVLHLSRGRALLVAPGLVWLCLPSHSLHLLLVNFAEDHHRPAIVDL